MPILCGTDLSAGSKPGLEVARALASKRGEELIVLHVIDPTTLDDDAAIEQRVASAQKELDAFVGGNAHTMVRVGSPEQSLAGAAETEGAELIVITATSTVGSESLLQLGSTAQRLIVQTHVPVILVRDPAPWLAFAHGERALRILLGVDDSAVCDLGIAWIHALRKVGAVDVVLGAIYYPDDAAERYGVSMKSVVANDPEVEKLLARDLLRRFGEGGTGSIVARCKVGLGRIGDHVLELARDEKVDAIVVGTGQKTGLGRLGSVSSVIVNDAPISVVCVPPAATIGAQAMPRLASVLVATNLSQFANRAVPYACAILPEGGTVHVINVIGDDAEVDEAATKAQLEELVPATTGRKVVGHIVRADDPATAIAQTGARLGVDVICIASKGRSGLTRALVGSVADKLLRSTRLPVLVLRPA